MKRLPFRLTSFAQGTMSKVEWVRHWLFNFAAVVSAVLCICATFLWIYSYWQYRLDVLIWQRHRVVTRVYRGSVMANLVFDVPDPFAPPGYVPAHSHKAGTKILWTAADDVVVHRFAGFGFGAPPPSAALRYDLQIEAGAMDARRRAAESSKRVPPAELATYRAEAAYAAARVRTPPTTWGVEFPMWSIAMLTVALPALWVYLRWRHRYARIEGHCATCGYDLRATPDRCPECGTIPPAAKGAAT